MRHPVTGRRAMRSLARCILGEVAGGTWLVATRSIHASPAALKKPKGRGIHVDFQADVWPARGPPTDGASNLSRGHGDQHFAHSVRGPFYAFRHGRDDFRGVVLTFKDFESLSKGVRRPDARRVDTLDVAVALLSENIVKRRFLAFRHGLNGARGIFFHDQHAMLLLSDYEAPKMEKYRFNNMTQALVFCEQAESGAKDWQTLENSIRFLARYPALRIPSMNFHYVVRSPRKPAPCVPYLPGRGLRKSNARDMVLARAESEFVRAAKDLPPGQWLIDVFEHAAPTLAECDCGKRLDREHRKMWKAKHDLQRSNAGGSAGNSMDAAFDTQSDTFNLRHETNSHQAATGAAELDALKHGQLQSHRIITQMQV
ncbi:hypothetical protein FVE85_3600 [Porphyridium purpureum]|uniref:Uncharacterized protein n=1 Tax=Porphyridium purpureum TaxID=35688 RepID=A0A5J4YMB3_PORPP|nr:hypothetical protein FVE85_3600 [Porphyridium purpureum]|eukprot:POR0468..scf249_10